MLRRAVMEQPLEENTHGRPFEDISQSLSFLPFLGHFPITQLSGKSVRVFHSPRKWSSNNSWKCALIVSNFIIFLSQQLTSTTSNCVHYMHMIWFRFITLIDDDFIIYGNELSWGWGSSSCCLLWGNLALHKLHKNSKSFINLQGVMNEENIKIEGRGHQSQCNHQSVHILTIYMKEKHIVEQQYSCTAGCCWVSLSVCLAHLAQKTSQC